MMKALARNWLVTMAALILVTSGCSRGPDSPEAAVAQAQQEITRGQQAAERNYVRAHRHYRQADKALDALFGTWPDSAQTASVTSGDTTFGELTAHAFRRHTLPATARLAKLEKDRDLFAVAEALIENIETASLRRQTRSELGHWLRFAGMPERAARMMRGAGEAQAEAALIERAAGVAEEQNVEAALALIDSHGDQNARTAMLLSIANTLAADGKHQQAVEIIDAARIGMTADEQMAFSGAVAISYGLARDYDKALQQAENTMHFMHRADAMLELSLMLSADADNARALHAAEQAYLATRLIEVEQTRAGYLATAARAALEAGDAERSADIFQESSAVADGIVSSRIQTESRGSIALEMASAGELEQAQEMLDLAERDGLSAGAQPQHLVRELRAYEVYARLGEYTQALEQLARINSLAVMIDAIPAVAAAYARAGEQPTRKQMHALLQHVAHWIGPPLEAPGSLAPAADS